MSGGHGRTRGLRPDTFPFLAVLLCAMGALILLLLVMDRRAKAVARAKAARAIAHTEAREHEAAATRRQEWEQRRAALRAALLRDVEDVRAQLHHTRVQSHAAAAALELEATRNRERSIRVQAETQQAESHRQTARQELARREHAARQTAAQKAERQRLADELRQIESTLADLRLLYQRRQQTYSVVPYRGKHGDGRRPLYVEVSAAGLLFHPDRATLPGDGISPDAIRAAVERRSAGQPGRPYLLLLVRPNGVPHYYRTQAALAGLEADYGYELIDADWELAFPNEGQAASLELPRPEPRSPPSASVAVTPRPAARGSGERLPAGNGVANPVAVPQAQSTPAGTGIPSLEGSGATPSGSPGLLPPSLLGTPITGGNAAPEAPSGAGPRQTTPPPRRAGAREWVIAVECRADAVVLYPGGARIPLTALGGAAAGESPLTGMVRQELLRHSGGKPHVRFLVRPDGARAYYRAFPLLDGLGAALTRQNLDADEPVGLEHLTR